MAKEDGSLVDSFGFDISNISNTNLYRNILNQDTQEHSLIWIDGDLYIFSGMPLTNDDGSDKNGVFLLGKSLSGDMLNYLISILEPENVNQFQIYQFPRDINPDSHNFSISIESIDHTLIIETNLQYAFANYIRERLIGNTILIITALFIIISGTYLGATLIAAKHRKILIQAMDAIHLSNHVFDRVPKNKITEFDMIGDKVNVMLDRMELNYKQLAKKILKSCNYYLRQMKLMICIPKSIVMMLQKSQSS